MQNFLYTKSSKQYKSTLSGKTLFRLVKAIFSKSIFSFSLSYEHLESSINVLDKKPKKKMIEILKKNMISRCAVQVAQNVPTTFKKITKKRFVFQMSVDFLCAV